MTDAGLQFLVVGAGRGGTSVLATALDAHPDLAVGFELGAVAILMGGDPRWAGAGPAERIAGFVEACRAEAARGAARCYGNKVTTEQIEAVAADRSALEALFDGPLREVAVVGIVRDGRTCVPSKVRRAGLDVAEACRRWVFSTTVLDVVRTMTTRHHVIRFEDLVTRPDAVLAAVCEFLGVPFHPAVLTATDSAQMPSEYRRAGFDPSVLVADDLPEPWQRILEPALRAQGYR